MNITIRWPTADEWKGFGRHVVTYSAGFATGVAGLVGYAVLAHLMTSTQASDLVAGLTNIASGLKLIVSGVTTFIGGVATTLGVIMGVWAALSSSRKAAAQIVAKIPGTTIVTAPQIASAVPAENVVANTNHTVVPPVAPSHG